jgi:hypothetical protein
MNKAFAFLSIALISAAAAVGTGCESDEGGTGGTGGTIGPLTWTTPGLTIVGDTCEFFVDEPLAFEITIEGSTVTLQDADPQSSLQASTDNYDSTDDEVALTGTTTNDNFPPCVVELNDAFELTLDDPDSSLDENTTVQVTWDHDEIDISDTVGDCAGEWFVDLPCAGEATFTLTQE